MVSVWRVFFVCLWIIVLWTGFRLGKQIAPYSLCTYSTEAEIVDWQVVEPVFGEFHVIARYTFWVRGKQYTKKHVFERPLFRNAHAAGQRVHTWAKRSWKVWYQHRYPDNSMLVRAFPLKDTFYFCVALGILTYFYWLRLHYSPRKYSEGFV